MRNAGSVWSKYGGVGGFRNAERSLLRMAARPERGGSDRGQGIDSDRTGGSTLAGAAA